MTKALMLALPEVSYLVERIPIAEVVLKPTAIHLRFCQHAKQSRMPLKEQCQLLCIPWHARKVSREVASKAALEAARITAPTVFAQAYPSGTSPAREWVARVVETKDWPAAMRHWLAFNVLSVSDEWELVKPYLLEAAAPAKGTAAKTVIERARDWERQVEEARRQRREQMNMLAYREAMLLQLQQNQFYGAQNDPYLFNALHRIGPGRQAVTDTSPIQYEAAALEPFAYGNFICQLLHTHEQFRAEGTRMHHCVETYFPRAKQGVCRIVSVEERGRKHATAEFTSDWELIQVKGPANQRINSGGAVDALRAFGAKQKAPAAARQPDKPVEAKSSAWTGITRGWK